MKTLSLLAVAVVVIFFIGIFVVTVYRTAGLISQSTSDAIGAFLILFVVAFPFAVVIKKIRAAQKRREDEVVIIGQCMNCGGRLGYHHWTCKRHREVLVLCSERCYYEHLRNAHRRHE